MKYILYRKYIENPKSPETTRRSSRKQNDDVDKSDEKDTQCITKENSKASEIVISKSRRSPRKQK